MSTPNTIKYIVTYRTFSDTEMSDGQNEIPPRVTTVENAELTDDELWASVLSGVQQTVAQNGKVLRIERQTVITEDFTQYVAEAIQASRNASPTAVLG